MASFESDLANVTAKSTRLLSVAALIACVGCASSAQTAELNAMGIRVHVAQAGWYQLRAEEGYRVSFPAIPMVVEEDFSHAGVAIPERFFDLEAEMSSRGFLARVFDARALSPEDREALRLESLSLFLPTGTEIRERHTVVDGGVEGEELVVDGYGHRGHYGVIHSVVRGGFIFQMLAIITGGDAMPSDVRTFFGAVRVDGVAP